MSRFDPDELEAFLQIIGALTAARMGDDATWERFLADAPDPRFVLAGLYGLTLSLMDTLERFGVPMDEYLQEMAAAAVGAPR